MAQPQLPVPNIVNINAAVNGMAANFQAFDAHRQQFTTELARCANYPVGQIQQQLAAIQQQLATMQQQLATMQQQQAAMQQQLVAIQQDTARIRADIFNMGARMQNGRISQATGALVVMRSVEQGANPQVPVGQAIPNFPGTPNDISTLNAAQCHNLLTSLDWPIPPGQVGQVRLRTAVREAVGLPAL